MNPGVLLNVLLMAGIAGFGIYCASYAFHVWRARNPGVSRRILELRGRIPVLARWSAALALAGFAIMTLAVLLRATVKREGVLTGEGLFTLRRPEGLEVETLTHQTAVKDREPIVLFHSPEVEAEIEVLNLRREALKAESQIISHRPLDPDPELLRRKQEVCAERRHLEIAVDNLVVESERVSREKSRDRLENEEELSRLEGELERVQREVDQTAARLALSRSQLAASESLYREGLVSEKSHDEERKKVDILEAEMSKLHAWRRSLEKESLQVRRGLEELETLARGQEAAFLQDITQNRERLAAIVDEEKALEGKLVPEVGRAELRRQERLEQIEIELQQVKARIAALAQTLIVPAPFDGTLAYRNPSPRMAAAGEPLLVLAPGDGLRAQVRLPDREAKSLSRAGSVTLELTDRGIERRFPGRWVQSRELEGDPGFVLAELSCVPPQAAVRELSCGDEVPARLLWAPPLSSLPLFLLGFVCLAAGLTGAGRATVRFVSERGGAREEATPAGEEDTVMRSTEPVAASADWQAQEGTVTSDDFRYRELGAELREALLQREIDLSLLAALEWVLDRNPALAVRHVSLGLGKDSEISIGILGVLAGVSVMSLKYGTSREQIAPDDLGRLRRILETVAPESCGGSLEGLSGAGSRPARGGQPEAR